MRPVFRRNCRFKDGSGGIALERPSIGGLQGVCLEIRMNIGLQDDALGNGVFLAVAGERSLDWVSLSLN